MGRTLAIDAATVSLVRDLYASGEAEELRLRHRLTYSDVSRSAGLTPGAVWKLERGLRTPRAETALQLASVLAPLLDLDEGSL